MDLKEQAILGDGVSRHWYYRSKAAALLHYVSHLEPRRILDVGAGSGFFSKHLLRHTAAGEAICVDPNYPAEAEERIAGKPVLFRTRYSGADADLVLLMDVLEHVDDDLGLLRDCVDRVPEGAHFLITVPAFSFLWSGHDVFLEHKRRYSLPEIERVARLGGLRVMRGSYFYGLVFPIAAATRLANRLLRTPDDRPVSQLRRHSPPVNATLAGICAVDLWLLKLNRLAGLSAFCLARKT